MNRCKDAAVLRQEVRHEGHPHVPAGGEAEFLIEFREVAMFRDVVGMHALGNLRMKRTFLRGAAGAGHPGH
jgi:hypothetical protein